MVTHHHQYRNIYSRRSPTLINSLIFIRSLTQKIIVWSVWIRYKPTFLTWKIDDNIACTTSFIVLFSKSDNSANNYTLVFSILFIFWFMKIYREYKLSFKAIYCISILLYQYELSWAERASEQANHVIILIYICSALDLSEV